MDAEEKEILRGAEGFIDFRVMLIAIKSKMTGIYITLKGDM
jgi:hypothetical protein